MCSVHHGINIRTNQTAIEWNTISMQTDFRSMQRHTHTHIHKQALHNDNMVCIVWFVKFDEKWHQNDNNNNGSGDIDSSSKRKNKAAVLYAFTHDERVWRYFTRMQLTLCTCLLVYVLTVAHQRTDKKCAGRKTKFKTKDNNECQKGETERDQSTANEKVCEKCARKQAIPLDLCACVCVCDGVDRFSWNGRSN